MKRWIRAHISSARISARKVGLTSAGLLLLGLWSTAASAVAASAATPAPTATDTSPTCSEHLPEGKERPLLHERFPERGLTGHATWLRLKLTHGVGETVLPSAFDFQKDSDAAKALQAAGFVLPDAKGPARVRVEQRSKHGQAESHISIAVVPLPKKPGRSELVLPPLPIAMARSSGEIITLCTAPHAITVEDPIANQPDAKPRATFKAARQREVWESLRLGVYGGLLGLAIAGVVALLVTWWRKRPKIIPPPPPPRPAWEVALESLHDIRQSRLIEQGRLDIHMERVSHTLRRYLGGRYGFEALESTSEEIQEQLRRAALARDIQIDVQSFLVETDLVKFADVRPTEAQCHWAFDQAEGLVHRTLPQTSFVGSEPTTDARLQRGVDDPVPPSRNDGGGL